jgi:UDP-3-O-[3-hydroxymyristoyl] glucosamine N-acyltransferase
MFSISLGELATKLDGKLKGDKNKIIHQLQDSQKCGSDSVCYIKSILYIQKLSSDPGAVITTADLAKEINANCIVVEDPYFSFALATEIFNVGYEKLNESIESKIHPSVKLGQNSVINANCIVVEDPYFSFALATEIFNVGYIKLNESIESEIHPSVKLGQNSVINSNCRIGKNVVIHDNVSIYPNTTIGSNCIIHSGVVIGSDGFGFAPKNNMWQKIYHLGGVNIGDNVEIGANSAIDRGVLGNTQLEDGVKLDNHVHVAHNVRLGANTAVAAQTAFAGSVDVGENCQIAGHVGVTGHLSIVDGVTVLANTLVTKSINKPGIYSGIMPMMEHNESLKFVAKLKKKSE